MSKQIPILTYYNGKVVAITVAEHYVHKGIYVLKGLGVIINRKGEHKWKLLGDHICSRKCWTLEKFAMHLCLKYNLMYVSKAVRGGKLQEHHLGLLDQIKPMEITVYDGLIHITAKERGI